MTVNNKASDWLIHNLGTVIKETVARCRVRGGVKHVDLISTELIDRLN